MGERGGGGEGEAGALILHALERTHVSLRFVLGRLALPLSQAVTLAPGQVLRLADRVSNEVDVLADGTSIGRGELVEVEGQRAIRLLSVEGADR